MRTLIQRVSSASVTVGENCVAEISAGLIVFLGIKNTDTIVQAQKLVHKISHLRIFADENGKMNLSVLQQNMDLLVVSQFTLYGNVESGNRPSYAEAAKPEIAEPIYDYFVELCRKTGLCVRTGIFRADMQVRINNDGPVSLVLDSD